MALSARRVRVDLKLSSQGRSGAVEPPAEDAIVGAVLPVALPDHHEAARAIYRDGRVGLVVARSRIDLKLRAQRKRLAEGQSRGGNEDKCNQKCAYSDTSPLRIRRGLVGRNARHGKGGHNPNTIRSSLAAPPLRKEPHVVGAGE